MSNAMTSEVAEVRSREIIRTSRRVTQWTFASLRLVLLLACLFLVTWLVTFNPLSWDLTEEKLFSVSPQTVAVLQSLEKPVSLLAFLAGTADPGIERVLLAYADASSKIDYRVVDPEAEPVLAAQYEVRNFNTLIVTDGDAVRRAASFAEPAITNAILGVARGASVPVCFTIGHGERAVAARDRSGLSAAGTALAQTNYEISTVSLGAVLEVPAECQVLVIAGPTTDLLPAEAAAVDRYLVAGGRLLAMVETRTDIPELAGVIERQGVHVRNDFVIDTDRNGKSFGLGIQVPMVDAYEAHPVTDGFRLMTLYNMPRSLAPAEGAAGLDVRALASSTKSSWGETRIEQGATARWDEGEDAIGPLPLVMAVGTAVEESAVAYRQRMRAGEPAPVGDPHMVVVGDADFAANALFAWQGNGDLLLNSVNWLAGQQELISIRPKEAANKRIELTDSRRTVAFALLVVLLPLFPAVTGVVTAIRRVK